METIEWSDKFMVGVSLIDEQHKKLIGMINKMIRDPAATTRSETVSDILTELTRYAEEHFKTEEEFMFEHGFPDLEQHKGQHLDFRRTVVEFCFATSDGLESVPEVLLKYLKRWLTQHILCEIEVFKQFLKEKGIKTS